MDSLDSMDKGVDISSYMIVRASLVFNMHYADANSLIEKFNNLFSGIVENSKPECIAKRLVSLLQARALFERTRVDFQKNNADTATGSGQAIELNKLRTKYTEIVKCERLLQEWKSSIIESGRVHSVLRLVLQLPDLFDPSCDIVLLDGSLDQCSLLQEMGIKRVISRTTIEEIEEIEEGVANINDLDNRVLQFPDFEISPPRLVTLVQGFDSPKPEQEQEQNDSLVKMIKALRGSIARVLTTRNTLAKFGQEWIVNGSENIKTLQLCKDFSVLKGKFEGFRALIVGPGPSLQQCLPLLGSLSERCTIICLSQALTAVRDVGISPDFVIVTDSTYLPKNFELGVGDTRAYVFDISSDPRHFSHIGSAERWPYIASDVKAYALKGLLQGVELPRLPTGGSVSHCAISFAQLLGFSEIVLVGHDFCVPNGRQYALLSNGESVHNHKNLQKNIVSEQRNMVEVQTNAGSVAHAPISYDIFRRYIEKLVNTTEFSARCQMLTFSLEGARINGVAYTSPEDYMATLRDGGVKKAEIPHLDYILIEPHSIQSSDRGKGIRLAEKLTERIHQIWEKKEFTSVNTRAVNEEAQVLIREAISLTRYWPEISLFLQEGLSRIDQTVVLDRCPERMMFLQNELLLEIRKGLGLIHRQS